MSGEQLQELRRDIEALVKTELTLGKLQIVAAGSKIIGYVLLVLTLILLVFAVLAFAAFAAVNALALCMPMWAACLTVGAVYVLIAIIVVLMRESLFINPLVKKLSAILFAEEGRLAEQERLRKEALDD